MAWLAVREKDRAACWGAGPLRLAKVQLIAPQGRVGSPEGTRHSSGLRSRACRVCPAGPAPRRDFKEQQSQRPAQTWLGSPASRGINAITAKLSNRAVAALDT